MEKPATREFYHKKGDGLTAHCAACHRAMQREAARRRRAGIKPKPRGARLPAEPFRLWVAALLESEQHRAALDDARGAGCVGGNEPTVASVAATLGIADRTVRRILTEGDDTFTLTLVDGAYTHAGRPDLFSMHYGDDS